MDVTAALRLFGGIRNVCGQMRSVVQSSGVTVGTSVTPTGQGARLLAKQGRCRVLEMRSVVRNLDALPFMVDLASAFFLLCKNEYLVLAPRLSFGMPHRDDRSGTRSRP